MLLEFVLVIEVAQLIQHTVANNCIKVGREGSIGIDETSALPNHGESVLKNILGMLARLQKTHGKVYQAALIGSVQFTKSILISIYQAENKCLFIN